MSAFHELIVDIKNCTSEKELLKIIQYIDANRKRLKLDYVDIEKLEAAGMRKYEQMLSDRTYMMKNKKQGFNNFD